MIDIRLNNKEESGMAMTFYPHQDNVDQGTLAERVEILMDAAERFKAVILEVTPAAKVEMEENGTVRRIIPRDQKVAFNWEEISRVLRAIRELPEISKTDKVAKADLLSGLSEVYEVLRGAKMSKLEAVRLALLSESNQLRGSSAQVA